MDIRIVLVVVFMLVVLWAVLELGKVKSGINDRQDREDKARVLLRDMRRFACQSWHQSSTNAILLYRLVQELNLIWHDSTPAFKVVVDPLGMLKGELGSALKTIVDEEAKNNGQQSALFTVKGHLACCIRSIAVYESRVEDETLSNKLFKETREDWVRLVLMMRQNDDTAEPPSMTTASSTSTLKTASSITDGSKGENDRLELKSEDADIVDEQGNTIPPPHGPPPVDGPQPHVGPPPDDGPNRDPMNSGCDRACDTNRFV